MLFLSILFLFQSIFQGMSQFMYNQIGFFVNIFLYINQRNALIPFVMMSGHEYFGLKQGLMTVRCRGFTIIFSRRSTGK